MAEIIDINELLGGGEDENAEVLTFYNGTVTLRYDGRPHVHAYYTVEDGVKCLVPGVSTVCGMIDKSGPLTQWAANETANYVRQKLNSGVEPFLKLEIEEWLEEARFNYRTISKQATDTGSLAHNWLEERIKCQIAGRHFAGILPEDEKAKNCINAALNWMEKHNFRPIQSERKIYSKTYGYAGTFDWLGYVTSCGDESCCPFEGECLALGDFKSSKRLYEEYRAQVAAYQNAWEEEFPETPVGVRIVLRLGKEDGEFEPLVMTQEEYETDLDGFLGALQTFNWMKQLTLNKKWEKDKAKQAKEKKPRAKRVRKAPSRPIIRETVYQPIPVEA